MSTQPDVGGRAAPRVSIVLPLYNSSEELPAALSELNKQSFVDREIILVDDGSTDGTWESAKALTSGHDDIITVRTEHRGPAHARNAGLQKSRGDIVFFSESDCVYDPAYLRRAVDCLDSQPGAAAVCLTGAPLITRSTLATRCLDIENRAQHRLLEQGKMQPFYAWVFRRSVLLSLGGFDDRLFQGEDRDLFGRLKNANYSVAWVPGVHWRHIRDQTTSELAAKWFSRGRTRLLYIMKHRRLLDLAKSIIPFWATVLGVVLLLWSPLIGGGILLLVAALFIARTLQMMSVTWPVVQKKRDFLGYPLFILVRNFATAMGYSLALVTIFKRRTQGKEIDWETL
jgi:glycosyltransferase involved in cell wall biosynthesis